MPDGIATYARMYREARLLGPLPSRQASTPTARAGFNTPAAARETLLNMMRGNLSGFAPPNSGAPPGPSPSNPSTPTPTGVAVVPTTNTSYTDNCRTLELFAAVSRTSDLVCSHCCQVGHLVEHCPRMTTTPAVEELPPVCGRCGEVGHEASQCRSSLT